jgi:hypothetical protein
MINIKSEGEVYLVTSGYKVLHLADYVPFEWLGLGEPYTVSLTVFESVKTEEKSKEKPQENHDQLPQKERMSWLNQEHKVFLAAFDALESKLIKFFINSPFRFKCKAYFRQNMEDYEAAQYSKCYKSTCSQPLTGIWIISVSQTNLCKET